MKVFVAAAAALALASIFAPPSRAEGCEPPCPLIRHNACERVVPSCHRAIHTCRRLFSHHSYNRVLTQPAIVGSATFNAAGLPSYDVGVPCQYLGFLEGGSGVRLTAFGQIGDNGFSIADRVRAALGEGACGL